MSRSRVRSLLSWLPAALIAAPTVVMAGAAYTHLANGEAAQVGRPLVFALVMWTALFLRNRAGRE